MSSYTHTIQEEGDTVTSESHRIIRHYLDETTLEKIEAVIASMISSNKTKGILVLEQNTIGGPDRDPLLHTPLNKLGVEDDDGDQSIMQRIRASLPHGYRAHASYLVYQISYAILLYRGDESGDPACLLMWGEGEWRTFYYFCENMSYFLCLPCVAPCLFQQRVGT